MKKFIQDLKESFYVVIGCLLAFITVSSLVIGTVHCITNGLWYLTPITAIVIPTLCLTVAQRLIWGKT